MVEDKVLIFQASVRYLILVLVRLAGFSLILLCLYNIVGVIILNMAVDHRFHYSAIIEPVMWMLVGISICKLSRLISFIIALRMKIQ